MTLEEFVNTYKVGSSYGYQGRYIGECVSLVKHYIKEVLDINPKSIGNAKQYWLKRNSEPYLYNNFTFGDEPQLGAIFCRTSGTYGHIGIVVSLNYFQRTYNTIEQNHNGNEVVGRYRYSFYNGFHFLYPKNTSNIGDITTGGQGEDSGDSEQNPEHDTPSSDDRFDFILYKLLGIL